MASSNVKMNGGLRTGTTTSMPPARTAPVRGTASTGRNNPMDNISKKSNGKRGGAAC